HDFFRRAIDDDASPVVPAALEPPHETGAAHRFHHRMPGRDRLQSLFDMTADPRDVRDEPAAHELVEDAERRAAREQVAAVRAAVIAELDRVGDLLADE